MMGNQEWRLQRQRQRLVEGLRKKGISDDLVLKAIGNIPRHKFIDEALYHRAYKDEALPIGLNQTISQPYTVAYQSMMLQATPGEKVLEIGTGSGYQAAVLCEMGLRVFSVERREALLRRAEGILRALGYRIVTKLADGSEGWPAFAPYDAIVVTAGALEVPRALLDQLKLPENGGNGGRLVIPVGDSESQTMTRYTRTGEEEFTKEETHRFRFVPLIRGSNGDEP